MKRHIGAIAVAFVLGLGALSAVGCGEKISKDEVNAATPSGAPAMMPASHEGRFESLKASGCYGCHGASERSNPMLNGTVALPENHYAEGSSDSLEIDPVREQCDTCHLQS